MCHRQHSSVRGRRNDVVHCFHAIRALSLPCSQAIGFRSTPSRADSVAIAHATPKMSLPDDGKQAGCNRSPPITLCSPYHDTTLPVEQAIDDIPDRVPRSHREKEGYAAPTGHGYGTPLMEWPTSRHRQTQTAFNLTRMHQSEGTSDAPYQCDIYTCLCG